MEQFTSQNEIINLLNLIRPWHLASHSKVRVGSDGDGGYVLPSSARQSNLMLSIGIGKEVSLDAELASLGAKVLQFDHTIEGAPLEHPNIRFLRQGWGPYDTDELLSLHTMMSMLDWEGAKHPILKFDVETAEWRALENSTHEDLARFEVITGEFHGFQHLIHREYFERCRLVFEKLAHAHLPIHLHANNAGGIIMVLGVPVPQFLEITYLRRDAGTFSGMSTEPIPGPLDRANMPEIPDLCLRPF